MRVRLASLLTAILLVPAAAYAESHKADLFGGGSGGNGGSTIGGWIAGINWGTACPWLDIVGPTASTQFGGHDGKSLSQIAYHGGARVTLTSMKTARDGHAVDQTIKPFVHVLVGGVYTNINDGSGQAFKDLSWTFGGGVDKFWHHTTLNGRDHTSGVGFRVQYDYIVRNGDHTNFSRVSAGIVWRILKVH